jgi:hypothetical protein
MPLVTPIHVCGLLSGDNKSHSNIFTLVNLRTCVGVRFEDIDVCIPTTFSSGAGFWLRPQPQLVPLGGSTGPWRDRHTLWFSILHPGPTQPRSRHEVDQLQLVLLGGGGRARPVPTGRDRILMLCAQICVSKGLIVTSLTNLGRLPTVNLPLS